LLVLLPILLRLDTIGLTPCPTFPPTERASSPSCIFTPSTGCYSLALNHFREIAVQEKNKIPTSAHSLDHLGSLLDYQRFALCDSLRHHIPTTSLIVPRPVACNSSCLRSSGTPRSMPRRGTTTQTRSTTPAPWSQCKSLSEAEDFMRANPNRSCGPARD